MSEARAGVEALYATGHWLLAQERCADASVVFRALVVAAPTDERGWLALGTCHERIGQLRIAAELFALGSVVAAPGIRCTIALARALRELGHACEADDAFDSAIRLAKDHDESGLAQLAEIEKVAS